MLFLNLFLVLTLVLAAPVLELPVVVKLTPSLRFLVLSSNVRTDTRWRYHHEHKWKERKTAIIQRIHQHSLNLPTLVGFQELKHNQLEDLLNGLNSMTAHPEWSFFGVGRDNGKTKGEYAPIFYKTDQWELVNGTTKWLSPTPDKPSKARSWGAANTRIVTFTTFRNKETGVYVNMINTHFDHKSEQARAKSAELILGWIKQIPNDYQTFLSGDFNSVSSDKSYKMLAKELSDTREVTKKTESTLATSTGFEPGDPNIIIDFIWCAKDANSENSKTTVDKYNVLDTWTEKGFRYSDHRPVLVDFYVKT